MEFFLMSVAFCRELQQALQVAFLQLAAFARILEDFAISTL
jgi:hypothetical protein